ncbi:hypothetical protein DQ384_05545 [Sphaerisporangium album]|uniref:Uncharacterized protein n=1 Tax=Sphaerisporangium album TaxID=509200 RepID=A0A367FQW4_9ACTN|nr:hypothetical protein [Sphaerisporangium album]RCG32005.1 hypothetical protein DQ384_05545 [Sphaerisporangium album]
MSNLSLALCGAGVIIAALAATAYAIRRTSIAAPTRIVGVVLAMAVVIGSIPALLDFLSI